MFEDFIEGEKDVFAEEKIGEVSVEGGLIEALETMEFS